MKTYGYLIAIEKEGSSVSPEDISDAIDSWIGTVIHKVDVEFLGEIDVYPEEHNQQCECDRCGNFHVKENE